MLYSNPDDNNDNHQIPSDYSWHGIWIVGLSLAALSLVLSSAGLTIQRAAHLREQQQASSDPRSFRRLKAIGIVLYISASVPDVLSYALLPQAIVANLSCCRLVLIAILAHTFLEERVGLRALIGIIICITGTVLCLNFGPGPTMHLLKSPKAFFNPALMMYMMFGTVVFLLLVLLDHLDTFGCIESKRFQFIGLPLATSLAYGLEKVFNTAVGFAPHDFWEPKWIGCYAAILFFGAFDLYLNLRGVKRLPIQVFVPAVFATGVAIMYMQSVLLFRELDHLPNIRIAVSLVGMILSLIGALCIKPPINDGQTRLEPEPDALLEPKDSLDSLSDRTANMH